MFVGFLLMISMAFHSIYFLAIEIMQISQTGMSYFNSVWNVIDFTPPILQMVILFSDNLGFMDEVRNSQDAEN